MRCRKGYGSQKLQALKSSINGGIGDSGSGQSEQMDDWLWM
jgi:hypothetical protein